MLWRASFAVCLSVGLLAPSLYAQQAAKRNVILIVSDDHGRDTGCYGNTDVKTPNLDKLAAEGTRFDYAFCTTASCSASRSVILSGLHNHMNGQYGHQHSYHHFSSFPSVKSLPVLLTQAGYTTARIGKYHVAPEEVYKFDLHLVGNQGGSRNPVSMAEKCREVIAAKDDKPFFIYFCTSDPHRGGGRLQDKPFQPDRFGNGPEYEGVDEVFYDAEKLKVHPFLPDTAACKEELAQYYQSVSRVDQGVGKLVEILKENGQYDNTLLLYISDNGMAFPGSKTTLYEPGMRLPLIVRSPDQQTRGGSTDALVSWADLTPTILDFAGVKKVSGPPAVAQPEPLPPNRAKKLKDRDYEFHGRSFLGVLDTPESEGFEEIYASHTFHEITMYYPMRVIRTRKYKLIYNVAHQLPFPFASDLQSSATWKSVTPGTGAVYGKRQIVKFINRPQFELYDLEADPDEVKNLYDDPSMAKVRQELEAKLKAFQEKTGDPWVVKYEYE